MTDSATSRHLDLDVLAELDEGIAGPEVERAARGHLDGCADCRDLMARLRTTRALLSTLPAEPMPEAVAARITAALEQADGPAAASGTVVPISRRGRSWNSPAVAGAAAVAAAVVLVGALVAGHVIHRGGDPSSAASSQVGTTQPKTADSTSTKEWATGANYTAATIPNLAPRLVTGTPPPNPSFGAEASGGSAGGTSGTVTNGPAQAPTPAAPSTAGVITAQDMRSNPSAVVACGTILAGGVPTVPVAVDFASYQGKPAVIFVLPAEGDKALLDVWVVKSTCSASSLDLYFRRIPRPTG